ncbi:MAG: PAS domain-containing protein [Candidatus Kapaibacterium sp.]
MKIPKSKQYKRIYNLLWVFYTFFVIIVSVIAYISIAEMNKMSVISVNFNTMTKVSSITEKILDSPSDYDKVQKNLERLKSEVDKLDLLYLDVNKRLKSSINTKVNELETVLRENPTPAKANKTKVLTQSIKEDSREFTHNILMKEKSTFNQTQKIVLILIILSVIVLTLALIFILIPAVSRLDKLALKLAQLSKEKEESLIELSSSNKEIYLREKRFATIAELSPIGLFLTDTKGKCQFVNQRYSEIAGFSYDECMGDGWKNSIYEEDRERIFKTWYESVEKNDDFYMNEYRVYKDGEFKNIAVKSKPIKDENNEITAFLGMIEDITKAKEVQADLQNTAKRFESLVDYLPYGVILNTDDGLYFNTAVQKIIGYTNDEIKTMDEWFSYLYKDKSTEIRNKYEVNKGRNFKNEIIVDIHTKSGEIRQVGFNDKTTEIGEIWSMSDKTELLKARLETQEINEEYKFILDSIKIGVWDWTIEPNILNWNERMYKIFDFEEGKKVSSYDDYKDKLHPEDVDRVDNEIAYVLTKPGSEFDSVFRIVTRNKEIRYIRAVSKTYRDDDGNAIRMVGLNWDITEARISEEIRKELSEKYELILNSTEIGVWDWDFRTNQLSWNDIMYSLFEVSKDSEDVFSEYEKKLHPDDKENAAKNLEKIMSGEVESYESEFRIILSNESTKYIKSITNIEKDENNTILRLYGINLDISELKEYQQQLIDSKEKAETANRAKSTFLANMSHEIRTPMNAILGFGEILQNNNKDERNRDYINGIIKSGNSLLSLINDILDFSKIEANKMTLNLNSVDIKRIISDIDRIFEFTASKKGIQYFSNFDENIPPYLILDEGKIKQILINLVGNAVKFTESGSVSLDVNFEYNKNETSKLQLIFTISDTGIGINSEKLTSIFNPFEQEEDNDSRKYEGTGLGLSIVKSIVELKKGVIEVESVLGKGSTFKVTIPDVSISLMRPNQVSDSTKMDFDKYDMSDKTVLFAEDIESNRNVVQGFLKDYAINVLFAHNGVEALELAKSNKIDLAFIDLHMPVMDGITMAEIWTNDEQLKTIPLIALTAEIYSDDKQLEKNYFKHYLTKPVRAEEIYDVILVETGMKEANPNRITEQDEYEQLTPTAKSLLVNHGVEELSNKLLKKLNTRELAKLIEKVEFISEMENNDSLREYTNELKLALETFNVFKIKQLLSLSSSNI